MCIINPTYSVEMAKQYRAEQIRTAEQHSQARAARSDNETRRGGRRVVAAVSAAVTTVVAIVVVSGHATDGANSQSSPAMSTHAEHG